MNRTEQDLRAFLHSVIDRLSPEGLQLLEAFLTQEEISSSVAEPVVAYQKTQSCELDDEDDIVFTEEFLNRYRNINPEERANTPIEECIPLDEVFDRLTDRMSAYYDVDMRKLDE